MTHKPGPAIDISHENNLLHKSLSLLFSSLIPAYGQNGDNGRIVPDVPGEGACIIDDITAREATQLALRRARSAAIETAAGIRISSGSVVKDSMLAADFIKSYSRGYIVKERAEWLPMRQYQPDAKSAPIPEYRVKLTADVFVPESHVDYNLEARLNKAQFTSGEKLTVTVRSGVPVSVAIFNIKANDEIAMLYPNRFDPAVACTRDKPLCYPGPNSPVEFTVVTLPDHKRNAEAVFVVAASAPAFDFKSIFQPLEPLGFTAFFEKYATIAHKCQDMILPYVVTKE